MTKKKNHRTSNAALGDLCEFITQFRWFEMTAIKIILSLSLTFGSCVSQRPLSLSFFLFLSLYQFISAIWSRKEDVQLNSVLILALILRK